MNKHTHIQNNVIVKLNEGNFTTAQREKEFEKIYNAFFKLLLSFVNRIGINYDDAEDVVIKSLTKVFDNIESYKPTCKFSTWVLSITKNAAIDHIRKKKNADVSLDEIIHIGKNGRDSRETIGDNIVSLEPSALEKMQKENRAEICRQIVSSIRSEKVKKCIELRYFRELTYDEIVEITNLPLGTVKGNIHRGRKFMLEYCKKHNIQKFL